MKIDLADLGNTVTDRWKAIGWLYKNLGPIEEGGWSVDGLRFIIITDERDATLFLLGWRGHHAEMV